MENNRKNCHYKGLNSHFSLVWASRCGGGWATREAYYCALTNQCQCAKLQWPPWAQLLSKAAGQRSKHLAFCHPLGVGEHPEGSVL